MLQHDYVLPHSGLKSSTSVPASSPGIPHAHAQLYHHAQLASNVRSAATHLSTLHMLDGTSLQAVQLPDRAIAIDV